MRARTLTWDDEERRLQWVLGVIHRQLAEVNQILQAQQGQVTAARRYMWENLPHGLTSFDALVEATRFVRDLQVQENAYVLYRDQVRRLARLADSPYFGRIDFRENEETDPEEIYIGIAGLLDPDSGQQAIYDWRAPIASLFYDYELGPAAYATASGEIRGEICLKRQYKIEHGRLLYMFDTNLKIDDEILQEMLTRSADEKMRTIVASIQREQNRVIRDERHPVLVVQGPAGSGKTSIALHRAAFLLYRYRDTLSARNIIIFGPNRLFADYISAVLPELGEENIQQSTLYELAQKELGPNLRLESMTQQLEYLLSASREPGYEERLGAIRYKASAEFFRLISNYVTYLEEGRQLQFEDLYWRDRLIISGRELQELYQERYRAMPVLVRLEKIRRRVLYLLGPHEERRRKELEAQLAQDERLHGEPAREIRRLARSYLEAELSPLRERLASWTATGAVDLYRRLHQDQALAARLAAPQALPSQWPIWSARTLARLAEGEVPYEDWGPVLFLKVALEGPAGEQTIRHVIVDEAQDYSVWHYESLRRLFPQARFTILGDLDQAVHPYLRLETYEVVRQLFGPERTALVRLVSTYRSTREITAFARGLLSDAGAAQPFQRPGPKPRVVRATAGALGQAMADTMTAWRQEGMKSVAVVCKTARAAAAFYGSLAGRVPVRLVTEESTSLVPEAMVMPIYLAKGLEFDAVIVPDADARHYAHGADRHLLYTACTRALHRLALFYTDELSPLVAAVPPELYHRDEG